MAGELNISPMLSETLVILGAAGIVIPAFARFRVNPVIGFILVGALVGPFGLGGSGAGRAAPNIAMANWRTVTG